MGPKLKIGRTNFWGVTSPKSCATLNFLLGFSVQKRCKPKPSDQTHCAASQAPLLLHSITLGCHWTEKARKWRLVTQIMLLSPHFSVRFLIFRKRNLETSSSMLYEWLPCLQTRLNEAHGYIHFCRKEILSGIPLFMSLPESFLGLEFSVRFSKKYEFRYTIVCCAWSDFKTFPDPSSATQHHFGMLLK